MTDPGTSAAPHGDRWADGACGMHREARANVYAYPRAMAIRPRLPEEPQAFAGTVGRFCAYMGA